MTLIVGCANVIGGILSLIAIDRLGRKFNLVIGTLIMAISMLLTFIGLYANSSAMVAIFIWTYVAGFGFGLGGAQISYTAEILPPKGVGISMAMQWIGTGFIGKIMPYVTDAVGEKAVILAFSIIAFNFFFILDFILIETKGKTENDIQDEFLTRKYRFMDYLWKSKSSPSKKIELNQVKPESGTVIETERDSLNPINSVNT